MFKVNARFSPKCERSKRNVLPTRCFDVKADWNSANDRVRAGHRVEADEEGHIEQNKGFISFEV